MTDPVSKMTRPRGSATFDSLNAAAAEAEGPPRTPGCTAQVKGSLRRLLPSRSADRAHTPSATTARSAMTKLRDFFDRKARDSGESTGRDSLASSSSTLAGSSAQHSRASTLQEPGAQISIRPSPELQECLAQECMEQEGCLVPDPSLRPEAAAVAQMIFDDYTIRQLMQEPREKCGQAALEVHKLLQKKNIEHQARSLLMWKSATDDCPMTHVAIVANIDGRKYIVDPTAAQFGECPPMFVPDKEWQQRLQEACGTRTMFYGDYQSLAEAGRRAGSQFRGHVGSYREGILMNAPSWYQKICRNPDAFNELVRKLGLHG